MATIREDIYTSLPTSTPTLQVTRGDRSENEIRVQILHPTPLPNLHAVACSTDPAAVARTTTPSYLSLSSLSLTSLAVEVPPPPVFSGTPLAATPPEASEASPAPPATTLAATLPLTASPASEAPPSPRECRSASPASIRWVPEIPAGPTCAERWERLGSPTGRDACGTTGGFTGEATRRCVGDLAVSTSWVGSLGGSSGDCGVVFGRGLMEEDWTSAVEEAKGGFL